MKNSSHPFTEVSSTKLLSAEYELEQQVQLVNELSAECKQKQSEIDALKQKLSQTENKLEYCLSSKFYKFGELLKQILKSIILKAKQQK